MIKALRRSVESSVLSSTVISLMGFLSYIDGRSRVVQETGNGSQIQRFWVYITNAVNGGESTPQRTPTEKEHPKEQQEESHGCVEYVVLTLDEDSSPQID